MLITLTPDLEDWIAARVLEGEFDSVEDGVRQLVEERIAARDVEVDDFAWAKPMVDEGLADIERGDTMTFEDFVEQTDAWLAGKSRK